MPHENLTPEEALKEFQAYRAFRMWLRRETAGNLEHAAAIILDFVTPPNDGEIGWLLLNATGDATYTRDTFLKAARIALETPDPEDDEDREPRDEESGPSAGVDALMPRSEGEGWE